MKSFEAIVTHQRYSKLNSQTHTNLKSANGQHPWIPEQEETVPAEFPHLASCNT